MHTRRQAVLAAASLALPALNGESGMAAAGKTLTFTSGGQAIAIERFDAATGGQRPAVLLLHGADGMSNADRYRLGAQVVAAAGYHVFLLHYLDRTGERRTYFSAIGRGFPLWAEAARDAIAFVEGQPGVDPKRIGMLGTSLGGALALAIAAEDRRVKAVVNYFGFLPEPVRRSVTRLPPVLVLHGAKDAIVPVANAHALEALLNRLGVPHEVHVYQDQAHGFHGAAQLDAAQRTAAFLARHLGGGSASLAPEAVPETAD